MAKKQAATKTQGQGRRRPAAAGRKPKAPAITPGVVDESFMSLCDAVAAKNGWKDGSIVASQARKLLVGLPVPSLSIEMLIMCSCWPLGRIFQLVGEEGCGKSTLLDEIIRWVMLHSGFAHIIENEAKDNAPVREAVLEHRADWLERRIRLDWAGSMDEWIRKIHRNMDAITLLNVGKPDDGKETAAKRLHWRCPYLYLVDSFTSTGTEKRQENIRKAGAPTQDHPREAGMLADELRTWPGRIRNTSIIFGGTNHMKPATDRFGHKVPKAPGGKSLKFMESLEIHMDKFPSTLDKVDRGGYMVSLYTEKNSFAPQHRRIWVNVIWEKEETDDPKHPRKRMYWDWHTATVDALLKFMAQSPGHQKAIEAVLDLNAVKGFRVWSEALGVPESKPVKYHAMGRLIDHNKEIRQLLRAAIGIEPMNHFRPYTPLREIYEAASPVTDDALDLIYVGAGDRDLSGFADVADALAGRVKEDKKRVDRQRQEAAEAGPEEDFFDDLSRSEFDD